MRRTVSAKIEVNLSGRTNLIYCLAATSAASFEQENLSISVDGTAVESRELADVHGTRLHQLVAEKGRVVLDYDAIVTGQSKPPHDDLDLVTYLRPSRYCESDTLGPTASGEFGGLKGPALLEAITSWVADKIRYVAGSSGPTDGAVQTLLDRKGVCRDFAHLTIALLRALNVPARLAAVYAPGLSPMEFHAVAEAYVDGDWYVVDPTRKAPRQSLLRIATGRDAADTAFLTSHWAGLDLTHLSVTAVVDELPRDDGSQLIQLR